MKGDFTRSTFKRKKHYSSVRMQQGRVQLDADWNEQMDIQAHLTQTEAKDIIGPCGVPQKDGGFKIQRVRLNGVYFLDNNKGFAVGDNATLLYTNDRGKNWIKTPLGINANLQAVYFIDYQKGWAVGDIATILLYTNDGEPKWIPKNPKGINANLRAVYFNKNQKGWAVGDNATILYSGDGGENWIPKNPKGINANLRAVHFDDTGRGVVVGDNATILYTDNGGNKWDKIVLPKDVNANLLSLDMPGRVAVGDNSTILYATGYPPKEWVKWGRFKRVDANLTLRAVHLGIVVGDDAAIYDIAPAITSGVEIKAKNQEPPLSALFISCGRIYVDGILCENEQDVAINAQSDFLYYPKFRNGGTYLFYLDVWHRHITALVDRDIREVALGGPDTTTRTKTVWQVKVKEIYGVNCYTAMDSEGWKNIIAPSTGKLLARIKKGTTVTDLCKMPFSGGYRRLENQLYRVEIHRGGEPATFKWSRDNGSVAALVEDIDLDGRITVSDLGKDSTLRFAPGQWIEVSDDFNDLRGESGFFAKLVSVDGNKLKIEALTAIQPGKNRIVRRWEDGERIVEVPATNDGWLELEDGIEIKFDMGSYRTGDYWQIPARTATGDIEWLRDESNNPIAQLPHGNKHHYCPLAFGKFVGGVWNITDCRKLFLPITNLTSDGIHVMAVQKRDISKNRWVLLENADEISIDEFAQGIRVICDSDIDPDSINERTCFITLNIPYPLTNPEMDFWKTETFFGFQQLILIAKLEVKEDIISWRPNDPDHLYLNAAFDSPSWGNLPRRLLTKFTLKGNFIQSAKDPSIYLDGETFIAASEGQTESRLILPSGDRRRGGDFEMWFYIVEKTNGLDFDMKIEKDLREEWKYKGILTLNKPARSGGIEIDLNRSSSKVIIPKKITIPAGEKIVTFDFTVEPVERAPHYVTITASHGGITKTSPKLTLNPPG